jgi:hypothetical protein
MGIGSNTVAERGQERLNRNSYLFTLRLWSEEPGGGQREWRGRVQHVLSGEVRYFRGWSGLTAFLQEMLKNLEDSENVALLQEEEGNG